MEPPVSITDKALRQIKEIILKKNIPAEYGLRIGIKGAGCAGVSYLLGFDKPGVDDKSYQLEGGLNLYVAKKHMMYILGLTLDFQEDEGARGFLFSNPDHDPSAGD